MSGSPMAADSRPPFSVLTIVFVAVLGHTALWCGMPVPKWILPIALGLAAVLQRPRWPHFEGWPLGLFVLLGTAAITYGAVATLDRSWDGFCTWSLTARHLAAGATLDHPYFANASVYQATRGYPLLQPILLQQAMLWLGERGGRVLFPLLWVLLLLAVQQPLRALGIAARQRAIAIAGLALVPLFLEPGHGSAESGFADLLLALLLTHGAAAIVQQHFGLALCIAFCLPLAKTEGTVHATALLTVATLGKGPRLGAALAIGLLTSLLGWLPMQARLELAPHAFSASNLLSFGLPIGALAWSCAVRQRSTRRATLVLTGVLAIAGLWLQPMLASAWPAAARPLAWSSLGSILGSLAQNLVWVRKFGFSYVVLFAAVVWAWRTRQRSGSPWPTAAPLLALQGAWFLLIVLFLLALPADRLPLFQREGSPRYLIQMIGVLWLCTGLLLKPAPALSKPALADAPHSDPRN